jgi:hypothetical protein
MDSSPHKNMTSSKFDLPEIDLFEEVNETGACDVS